MNVLTIPDLHLPATHPHALEFCVDTYNKYKCDKVVLIGDIGDSHGISFHPKNPRCPSSQDEYEQTLIEIQQWYDTFTDADAIIGNHDERYFRLAESVNIPSTYLKAYSEVWNTPNWNWCFETEIDDVYYFHGTNLSGKTPALNKANSMGMSVVMGHAHSVAGVHWGAGPKRRWFGLDVGCLINREAYQFRYGRHLPKKPILGCGVVLDGDGYFIPMPLEKYKEK